MGSNRRRFAKSEGKATGNGAKAERKAAKIIQVVCSHCCQPFPADANVDRSHWKCPHCVMSTEVETPAKSLDERLRSSLVSLLHIVTDRPLARVALVLIAFLIFVGASHFYLRHKPGIVYVGGKSNEEITALTHGVASVTPTNVGSDGPAGLATANQPRASSASDSTNRAGRIQQGPEPTTVASDGGAVSTTRERTGVAARQASHRQDPAAVEGGVSLRDFLRFAPRLYGRDLRLPCRLIAIEHDVLGAVPNHFKVNGETVRIPDVDEDRYVRLVVADQETEAYRGVFMLRDDHGHDATQWLRPGDWLVLHGTPGMRYDRISEATAWGFVVTKISELNAAGTSSGTPAPTTSSNFVPTAARPALPGQDW
ncbi:MAG: hypothetical protein KDA92_05835 [Planctomycetales bacterium]|nr:hypothetical protein [Planctomycetales bacterium]MCA9167348.1 hypothetical protein [Planctomycetales bacterium]